ncbi:MAG: hypothetical protein IJ183_01255 [Prevotella sp.]|nr:hypothetical protein [Prevotella sp.]
MKKLLTLLTLLVAIVTGAWAGTTPDYESYDWASSEEIAAALGEHEGVTVTVVTSGSDGNVSGHYYKALNSAIDGSATGLGTYLSISSAKQIEKVEVFYCPNGTQATNLAWAAWGKDVTPSAEVGTNYGTTTGVTSSKSWDNATWEEIDLSSIEAYTIFISRQGKKLTNNSKTISNFGGNQTVNLLGFRVYLVDEGAVKHTVTYSLGEGTGTAPTQGDVAEAGTFTVKAAPNDLVAPNGKEFKCWNDGTSNYNAGATYTMGTSDVTLTAVYQKEREKKIIYSLVNGIGSAEVTATTATVNDGESLVLSDTNGRIMITAADGETFKAGDIITFTGGVGSAADKPKPFGVKYGSTTSVSSSLSYSDDITVADGSKTVSGTITLSEDSEILYIARLGGTTTTLTDLVISRPIPSENIAFTDVTTYVTENAIDFSEVTEVAAYVVTEVNTTTNKVITEKVGAVPAGTALLIKGDGAEEVNVPIVASAEAPATNLFQVSDGTVVGGDNIFAYSKSAKKFSKVKNTVTIPEGKCYLQIEGVTVDALSLDFEGEATAVEAIAEAAEANVAPVKVIKNGKLYIGNYNIAGQQVK